VFIPHLNLWVERNGYVVASHWRIRLLETIAETGSISAAAERLGIQYRLAWQRLEEMETGLGQPLVERQAGGAGGGGTHLTDIGRDLIERFNRFAAGMDEAMTTQSLGDFGPEARLHFPTPDV
jgi:molybdate transport system regulatory protein